MIFETLRINSSSTISSALALTETTQIYDKIIRSDSQIMIGIHRLHMNPDQWKEATRFIPERFDPLSPYYLTPDNKRRSPMSFGPFLGGKRVCLGKTFAENVAKAILPVLLCQLDFIIPPTSDIFGDRKPSFSLFSDQPYYGITLRDINQLNEANGPPSNAY